MRVVAAASADVLPALAAVAAALTAVRLERQEKNAETAAAIADASMVHGIAVEPMKVLRPSNPRCPDPSGS